MDDVGTVATTLEVVLGAARAARILGADTGVVLGTASVTPRLAVAGRSLVTRAQALGALGQCKAAVDLVANLAAVVAHRSVALVGNVTLVATALAGRVPVALYRLVTHPTASGALGDCADTVRVTLGTAPTADNARAVVHVMTLTISDATVLAMAEATLASRRSLLVRLVALRLLLADDAVHDDLTSHQDLRRGSRLPRGQHQRAHHHLIRVLDGAGLLLNVLVISGHCDSMRGVWYFEFEQMFDVVTYVDALYHFFGWYPTR